MKEGLREERGGKKRRSEVRDVYINKHVGNISERKDRWIGIVIIGASCPKPLISGHCAT
jgi:hypothetical protein